MTRVLVTSFEPFGGHEVNSSLEVGRALAPVPGIDLHWHTLPVAAGVCVERAWALIDEFRPELVVSLGQAGSTALVRLEDRGINLDHFSMPDNAGQVNHLVPVVAGGPALIRTPVPVAEVAERLAGDGQPVTVTYSAGSYVCNHLYYHLLHRAAGSPRVLFVHLPLLPQQRLSHPHLFDLPLARQVECVRRIVLACAAE